MRLAMELFVNCTMVLASYVIGMWMQVHGWGWF